MTPSALPTDATKYTRGVVAVVAGSETYPGAAVLCVAGARRGGAGYVRHISPDELCRTLVLQRFPDVVTSAAADFDTLAGAAAVAIGSGTAAAEPWLTDVLRQVLGTPAVVVVDGGALDVLRHDAQAASQVHTREVPVVITPHFGEALRLLPGLPAHRSEAAVLLAHKTGAVVVLKGPGTVVATADGLVDVDDIGGPELATAGTGDVLAGLCASMLAAQVSAQGSLTMGATAEVAAAAVRAHSLAGRAAASAVFSVTALDVADALGAVMRGLRG